MFDNFIKIQLNTIIKNETSRNFFFIVNIKFMCNIWGEWGLSYTITLSSHNRSTPKI